MARNPKQDANLKPIKKGELSNEELKKRQSNGGKKSAEVRKAKRDARDAARYILNCAAKGSVLENAKLVGASDKEGKITNLDALHARLFSMAIAGNLDAYLELMKAAGYDAKENREERESVNADRRKNIEMEAKLKAIGQNPEGNQVALNMNDEDGKTDVVIYIPKMMEESECAAEDDDLEEQPTDTNE